MASVLASSAVDVGSSPDRVKLATIKLVLVASPLRIRIMCPSGAICLSADCCFSELAI